MNSEKKSIVILIEGPSASGKSTLARALSTKLNLPLLAKDDIKENLFDSMGIKDVAWSQMLGGASFDLFFYFLELMLKTNTPFIAEGSFHAERQRPVFERILNKHGHKVLEVIVTDEPDVLANRFQERWLSGNRHKGHQDGDRIESFQANIMKNTFQPLKIAKMDDILTLNGGSVSDWMDQVIERKSRCCKGS